MVSKEEKIMKIGREILGRSLTKRRSICNGKKIEKKREKTATCRFSQVVNRFLKSYKDCEITLENETPFSVDQLLHQSSQADLCRLEQAQQELFYYLCQAITIKSQLEQSQSSKTLKYLFSLTIHWLYMWNREKNVRTVLWI